MAPLPRWQLLQLLAAAVALACARRRPSWGASWLEPRGLLCGGRGTCRLRSKVQVRASKDDPWVVLGVSRAATMQEIKQVYRRRALKEHPDVDSSPGSKDRWQRLSEAYGKLTDPVFRARAEQEARLRQEDSLRNRAMAEAEARARKAAADAAVAAERRRQQESRSNPGFAGGRAPVDAVLRRAKATAEKVAQAGQDLVNFGWSRKMSTADQEPLYYREKQAAEQELVQLQQAEAIAKAEAERCFQEAEACRFRGDGPGELRAGKRTLEARQRCSALKEKISRVRERLSYWSSVQEQR